MCCNFDQRRPNGYFARLSAIHRIRIPASSTPIKNASTARRFQRSGAGRQHDRTLETPATWTLPLASYAPRARCSGDEDIELLFLLVHEHINLPGHYYFGPTEAVQRAVSPELSETREMQFRSSNCPGTTRKHKLFVPLLLGSRAREGGINTWAAIHNLESSSGAGAVRFDAGGRAARRREYSFGGQRADVLVHRPGVPRRRHVRLRGVGAMRWGRGCSALWPWKWTPATASSPRCRWCRSQRCRIRNRRSVDLELLEAKEKESDSNLPWRGCRLFAQRGIASWLLSFRFNNKVLPGF